MLCSRLEQAFVHMFLPKLQCCTYHVGVRFNIVLVVHSGESQWHSHRHGFYKHKRMSQLSVWYALARVAY